MELDFFCDYFIQIFRTYGAKGVNNWWWNWAVIFLVYSDLIRNWHTDLDDETDGHW